MAYMKAQWAELVKEVRRYLATIAVNLVIRLTLKDDKRTFLALFALISAQGLDGDDAAERRREIMQASRAARS